MPVGPAGGREREILTAIVETFIASGEPVGSRTLARSSREGLSAATIRNVMADLADAGFLEQPHASAGRVPTAEAYRYYVEQLSGEAHLSHENQSIIQDTLTGVTDVEEFMERTSHVLALISHGVGLVSPRRPADRATRWSTFTSRAWAIRRCWRSWSRARGWCATVCCGWIFRKSDLDLAARYINENFRGWTMGDMRAELARRLEQERSEYDRLMKSIEQLYQQGALASNEGTQAVFVEGAANLVTNLVTNSVVGQEDRQRLQDMLRTLEEKEKVVKLLSAYLDTRQEAVRVVIGLDEALPASNLQNFVLIGAPARVGGEVMGSLAVIGPTRLDYQHTMSAVSYIARLFDKLLNESE